MLAAAEQQPMQRAKEAGHVRKARSRASSIPREQRRMENQTAARGPCRWRCPPGTKSAQTPNSPDQEEEHGLQWQDYFIWRRL